MALRGPHRRPRTRLLPEDPPSRRSPSSRALPEKSPRMPVERSFGRDAVSRHGPPGFCGSPSRGLLPCPRCSLHTAPSSSPFGGKWKPTLPPVMPAKAGIHSPAPELRPRTAPHSIGRANCSGSYAVITMRGRRLAMIESIIDAKGQTTLPKAVREALSVQPGDRVRTSCQ